MRSHLNSGRGIARRLFLSSLLLAAVGRCASAAPEAPRAPEAVRISPSRNPIPSADLILAQAMSEREGLAISQKIKNLVKQALPLIEAGQFAQAETLLNQEQELIGRLPDRTGGLRWRRGAMLGGVKDMLGSVYMRQGRFDEAEKAFRESLDANEKEWGLDSKTIVEPLLQIASSRMRQGKMDGVEDLLRRGVAIAEANMGSDSMEAAEIKNSLASYYGKTGQSDKAAALFKQAIATFDSGQSPQDRLSAAQSRDNLGTIYMQMGRFDEARASYEQAYEVEKSILC